jgi:hypothetical protein
VCFTIWVSITVTAADSATMPGFPSHSRLACPPIDEVRFRPVARATGGRLVVDLTGQGRRSHGAGEKGQAQRAAVIDPVPRSGAGRGQRRRGVRSPRLPEPGLKEGKSGKKCSPSAQSSRSRLIRERKPPDWSVAGSSEPAGPPLAWKRTAMR